MNRNNTYWVEKYRPNNINKIIQNDDIKKLISSNNNLSNLPHLLLYGPPGTGKTTTAISISKYIFNNKILKERVLELNASDERGIKIVREKIKTFASNALNHYENIPSFKIIILDEADMMTNDSQFALRRIIEQYSHITRFILICNYVTKIIPPLVSRCSKYRFNIINKNIMDNILLNILNLEKIEYDNNINNILNIIYDYSNGDLRKAITILQRLVYIKIINNKKLDEKLILDISGYIPIDNLNNLYISITNSNVDYIDIRTNILNILNNGYSSLELLNKLSILLLNDNNINDNIKSKILIKISDISSLISNGSNDYIQILSICSYINNIYACNLKIMI
jgi:replication factor C subunit 2/4